MSSVRSRKAPDVIDILGLLRTGDDCVAMARKHRVSLAGTNFYASKFLDLRANGAIIVTELRKRDDSPGEQSTGAIDEIETQMQVYFDPRTSRQDRAAARTRIVWLYRSVLEPRLSRDSVHAPTDSLFPLELLRDTRGYIEKVGLQAAGSYDLGWHDAAAVMIRRLLETLIIECFERQQIQDKIKDSQGNYLFLQELIPKFLAEQAWTASRNVRTGLPRVKELGDLSAHSRRYTAKKADIDSVRTEIRTAIEELVTLAFR